MGPPDQLLRQRNSAEGGVAVFSLTAEEVRWEVSKGNIVSAMGFNGVIPGPQLEVHEGERIRVEVQNKLPADQHPLPRDDGSELTRRCAVRHAGTDHARPTLEL